MINDHFLKCDIISLSINQPLILHWSQFSEKFLESIEDKMIVYLSLVFVYLSLVLLVLTNLVGLHKFSWSSQILLVLTSHNLCQPLSH